MRLLTRNHRRHASAAQRLHRLRERRAHRRTNRAEARLIRTEQAIHEEADRIRNRR